MPLGCSNTNQFGTTPKDVAAAAEGVAVAAICRRGAAWGADVSRAGHGELAGRGLRGRGGGACDAGKCSCQFCRLFGDEVEWFVVREGGSTSPACCNLLGLFHTQPPCLFGEGMLWEECLKDMFLNDKSIGV